MDYVMWDSNYNLSRPFQWENGFWSVRKIPSF